MKSLVFRPSSIIGLEEDEAKRIVEKNSFFWRITKRDDQYPAVTRDIREDRISLNIENGVVVDAYVG